MRTWLRARRSLHQDDPLRFVRLSPPHARGSIRFRDSASGRRITIRVRDDIDNRVADQVLSSEDYRLERLQRSPALFAEYARIVAAGRMPLILDCGGNIGLVSFYFSHVFPAARIVCVEPEPSNMALARENNSGHGVLFCEAAVGSTDGFGAFVDPGAEHDAFRIRPDADGGVAIQSIDHLIDDYGEGAEPFVIKIDIEGFGSELFSANTGWIDRFPLIIVELHDWMLPGQASSRNFLKAIAAKDRDFVHIGENVFSLANPSVGERHSSAHPPIAAAS